MSRTGVPAYPRSDPSERDWDVTLEVTSGDSAGARHPIRVRAASRKRAIELALERYPDWKYIAAYKYSF